MKTKKCFIGIEAEGPFRGAKTLFVPGSIDPKELGKVITRTVVEDIPVERIYYGAGEDWDLRKDTLESLIRCFGASKITIEVRKLSDIPYDTDVLSYCTIVSLDPEDRKKGCWYKRIYHTSIEWFSPDQNIEKDEPSFATSIFDPLFNQDKEIE